MSKTCTQASEEMEARLQQLCVNQRATLASETPEETEAHLRINKPDGPNMRLELEKELQPHILKTTIIIGMDTREYLE